MWKNTTDSLKHFSMRISTEKSVLPVGDQGIQQWYRLMKVKRPKTTGKKYMQINDYFINSNIFNYLMERIYYKS